MIRRLAACFALLLPLPALAQEVPPDDPKAKCVEWDFNTRKPMKKPPPLQLNNIVAGPSGPERVEIRQAAFKCDTSEKGLYYGWGMRNAAGKVVVPYRYFRVHPTSPSGALVLRDGEYSTYTDGKGEKALGVRPEAVGSVDDHGPCNALRSGGARTVYLTVFDRKTSLFDLWVYHGSEEPVITPRGQTPRRVHKLLFTPVNAADGTLAAQVLDSYGNPVSGVLGAISYWHAAKPQYGGTCEIGMPDMLSKGPSLDQNPYSTQAGDLYFPLAMDGSFYPMPDGAIGIFPLRAPMQFAEKTLANDNLWEYFSDTWALVYPDAQGWSFSIHRGAPLQAISSATGTEPRYRNLTRGAAGLYAAQDVKSGNWKVFLAGSVAPMELAGTYNTGSAAVLGAEAEMKARRDAIMARLNREIAEREAREVEQTRKVFAAARARGLGWLCQYSPPHRLPVAELADFARACPGQWTSADLAKAKAAGMSADAVAAVEEGWRQGAIAAAYAAKRQREMEANPVRRPYVPGAWSDAIRQAGDQIVADINRRSENWFEQRQKSYREEWQRKQRAY